jgi:hypothetical protein
LYGNIFHENADNSKEFSTFVQGYPHDLRVKVEDWITENSRNVITNGIQRDANYLDRFNSAYELDTFITDYIENHYV